MEFIKDSFLSDAACNRLTNAFWLNLLANIEEPYRIGKKKLIQKRQWLEEVRRWAKKETFWLEMYEFFCGYNGERLRQIVLRKIDNKLEKLKNEEEIKKRKSALLGKFAQNG